MATHFNHWLKENTQMNGVLACAIRYADRTTFFQGYAPEFTAEATEEAWRCLGEAAQLFKKQRQTMGRLCWTFESACFHVVSRSDGTSLGVFTARPQGPPADALDRLLNEFQTMPA